MRRVVGTLLFVVLAGSAYADATHELALDVHKFEIVKRDSGPTNYYRVIDDPQGAYIRSAYKPPYDTMTQGYRVPDEKRRTFHKLRWKWRALALPTGGNECADDKGDSAAVVYVTWKRGLKWYALKYVWSAVGPKGAVCDKKSNWFRAQQTVILESGAPLNAWADESIDLDAEYRKHFEDGDPKADVPDFMGIAIMSDGDQTHSPSSADFGGFVLSDK